MNRPKLISLLLIALMLSSCSMFTPKSPFDRPSATLTREYSQVPGFGERKFKPFFFIQSADPHITNAQTQNMFMRIAEFANKTQPAFLLVCGDLISNPSNLQQADLFDATLARLQVPTIVIPGNHDMQAAQDLQFYRDRYGDDYFNFRYNGVEFVALNSEILVHPEPYGDDPEQQWKWLEGWSSFLGTHQAPRVYFLAHHPPYLTDPNEGVPHFNPTSPVNWPTLQRARVLNAARAAGCNLFFCGHVHKTEVYGDADFKFYTVAGTQADFDKKGLGFRLIKVLDSGVEQFFVRVDGKPDKSPPSHPLNLQVQDTQGKKIRLTWDPSQDNVGVMWYNVFRDGTLLGRTLQNSFADKLARGETYSYAVFAEDLTGNRSESSDLLSFKLPQ